MNRICPFCKENLGTIGNYFCYACGEKLPQKLTQDDVRQKKPDLVTPEFIVKNEFSKAPLILIKVSVLLLVALGAVYAFSVFRKAAPIGARKVNVENQVITQASKEGVIKFNLDLPQADFSNTAFAALAPHDSDIYVEGADLMSFITRFTNLDKNLLILGSRVKLSDISENLRGRYAIFSVQKEASTGSEIRDWGVIAKPKSIGMVEKIEGIKEASSSITIVDDYIVYTSTSSVLKEIKDVRNKVALSLALNSKYASAKNSLPKSGKLFVLLLNNTSQSDAAVYATKPLFNAKFKELIDILVSKDKNSYVVD